MEDPGFTDLNNLLKGAGIDFEKFCGVRIWPLFYHLVTFANAWSAGLCDRLSFHFGFHPSGPCRLIEVFFAARRKPLIKKWAEGDYTLLEPAMTNPSHVVNMAVQCMIRIAGIKEKVGSPEKVPLDRSRLLA